MKKFLIISMLEIIIMDLFIFIFLYFQKGNIIGGFITLIAFHLVIFIHLLNKFTDHKQL